MHRLTRHRGDDGFTLVEVLVTVVVLSIITVPLANVFFASFRTTGDTIDRFRRTRDLSQVAGFFVSDVQSSTEATTSRIAQQDVTLTKIRFADPTNGWAVGTNGTIIATDDGGATWIPQDSTTSIDLLGLASLKGDIDRAWAVGRSGTILVTIDGGETWEARNSGTTSDLNAVWFKDANNGIAIGSGGTIVATTNGGGSWQARSSTVTTDLFGISFRDSNNGIVVGAAGTALWTANFGSTWAQEDVGKRPPTSATLRAVSVRDDSRGWAVGDGGVLLSCNRNCTKKDPTWVTTTSGTTVDLTGVWGIDSTHVWVSGGVSNGFGTILFCETSCTTTGAVWTAQTTGATSGFNAIYALDATHAWASGAGGATATFTVDRWSLIDLGTTSDLRALSLVSSSGIVAGANGFVRTTSNGAAWNSASPGSGATFNGASYRDDNEALIVGDGGVIRGCSNNCNAASSVWNAAVSPSAQDLLGVHYVGGSSAWAVGRNGTVLRCTANCNRTTAVWALLPVVPLTTKDLFGVYSRDNTHTWVVGADGTLLFFNGTTWSSPAITWLGATPAPLPGLRGVFGLSSSSVWAVGDAGTILYYDGTSWTQHDSGSGATLRSVHATSTSNVWTAGSGGTVLTSTDNLTWTPMLVGTPIELYAIRSPAAGTEYVAGASGSLLTSGAGGTPYWTATSDDTLQARAAPACPGADPLVVNLSWQDAVGDEIAISYVTRTVAGERQLVRQQCHRSAAAEDADPFTLESELTVARFLAPGDPVLTPACMTTATCDPIPDTLSLTFTGTSGAPFSVSATRRSR